MAAFVAMQIPIAKPFESSCKYDLVMENKKGGLKKVQIKTGSLVSDGSIVTFICCGMKINHNSGEAKRFTYTPNDIDYFAIYVHDIKSVYLMPIEDVVSSQLVRLRVKDAKNNQKKRMKYARDYIFYKF